MGEDICKWYVSEGADIQNIQGSRTTQHQNKNSTSKQNKTKWNYDFFLLVGG